LSARVAEVRSEQREQVPQHARGSVRRQPAEFGNAQPEFLEMEDCFRAAAGRWKYSIGGRARQALQYIAGGMRQIFGEIR
jgi:hypothetical protein